MSTLKKITRRNIVSVYFILFSIFIQTPSQKLLDDVKVETKTNHPTIQLDNDNDDDFYNHLLVIIDCLMFPCYARNFLLRNSCCI
jgi:hypothetical protein